jgi:phosphate transport system substrate-binding protein
MKKYVLIIFACIFALLLVTACNSDSGSTGEQAASGSTEEQTASGFDTSRDITVISRETGSGTRGAFVELTGVEVSEDGNTTDMTTPEAVIGNGTNAIMTNVAGDSYAIGYISTGSINNTIKTVSIDGVEPTPANILTGSYNIARPFIIVTMDDLSPVAQDFIDFIMSDEGQEIVAGSYIPVDQSAPAFESNRASGTVVVGGSTSVSPVMESLAEAYEAINGDASIEIHSTGSGAGITGAIDGVLDIGMSSRDIRDSEMDELHQQITIAMDGIAIIVNNDNPIANLTMEEVREIFVGEKTRWSEVG